MAEKAHPAERQLRTAEKIVDLARNDRGYDLLGRLITGGMSGQSSGVVAARRLVDGIQGGIVPWSRDTLIGRAMHQLSQIPSEEFEEIDRIAGELRV